jgi:hypothetical protein
LIEGGGGFEGVNVAGDFGGARVIGHLQVVAGLQVHPEGGVVLEVAGEAQGGVGGDAAALVDDIGDARDGDAKVEGEFVHAETQRLEEFLAKDFAVVDGFAFRGHPLIVGERRPLHGELTCKSGPWGTRGEEAGMKASAT